MTQDTDGKTSKASVGLESRTVTPEAQRALAEAAARRAQADETAAQAKEYNGRGGLEPVRFGDWEVKGIATDF